MRVVKVHMTLKNTLNKEDCTIFIFRDEKYGCQEQKTAYKDGRPDSTTFSIDNWQKTYTDFQTFIKVLRGVTDARQKNKSGKRSDNYAEGTQNDKGNNRQALDIFRIRFHDWKMEKLKVNVQDIDTLNFFVRTSGDGKEMVYKTTDYTQKLGVIENLFK